MPLPLVDECFACGAERLQHPPSQRLCPCTSCWIPPTPSNSYADLNFRDSPSSGQNGKTSPNLVTIELFTNRFYSMLVDTSRSSGLYCICILKVAMPIRRRTALVVLGIAVILMRALIFVVPALINVNLPAPGDLVSPRKNRKAGRNRTAGAHVFSCNDSH